MNIDKLEQRSHRIRYLTLSALSFLVLAYVVFFSWHSWEEQRNGQLTELTTIMELGEKSLDTYFRQMEIALQSLAMDIRPGSDSYQPEHARQLVKRFKALRPEVSNVVLVRADGLILLDAITPASTRPISLAQSSSFIQYLEEAATGPALIIGRPTLSRTANVWVVPVRYGIKARDGRLAYTLVATLPVQFLQGFWQDAPITQQAAIGLMRDDGFLLSRYPVPAKASPVEIYDKPRSGALFKYLREQQFPEAGSVLGPSSLEGPNFLNVFRRLSHYPLTLFVAMPMQAVYEQWWNKIETTLLLTALFLLSGGLVYFLARRQQRAWNEERSRIDRIKADFISVVSHELRTPITSIRGSLGLLESGVVGAVPPEAQKMISIAHKNSLRLIALVNDILDMEKLLSGKLTVSMQRVDLVALVQQSLEANDAYAQGLRVQYVFREHPGQAWVLGDADRLLQVLANLLSNAAKFSQPGEQVEIRVVTRDLRYRVEVQDHGEGIPPAFRSLIFQPFAQADMSNTRQRGGSGLGLNISKQLIEKMDGSIGFESEAGRGTTFWFELPVRS